MSGAEKSRPIVIKRPRRAAKHGSHGAWKIAYADFMTAMMAFFLVMWLLGGLSDQQMDEVSEYFRTPLVAAIAGGDKTSASVSAIPGGGDDPTHTDGEQALTRLQATNYTPDRGRLRSLKQRLETLIHSTPELEALASQLRVELVRDGLRIQILDDRNRPMFALGSTRIQAYMTHLLEAVTPTLNTVENKITLTGHTDDLRYADGENAYSNWELSADRANAARRTLVSAGLDSSKLLRVIGAAATQRVNNADAHAPENRRISILVLNAEAQHRIEHPNERVPSHAPPEPASDRLATRPLPARTDPARTSASPVMSLTPHPARRDQAGALPLRTGLGVSLR